MIWQAARYQPKLYVVQGIGPSLALGSNLIAGNHHDLAILKGNDKKGRLHLRWISFPSAHDFATAASCNEKKSNPMSLPWRTIVPASSSPVFVAVFVAIHCHLPCLSLLLARLWLALASIRSLFLINSHHSSRPLVKLPLFERKKEKWPSHRGRWPLTKNTP